MQIHYIQVTQFLNKIHLPISNLIGLVTNGRSNFCGKIYSLYTLLKRDAPKFQLIKCVCHSLNLAATAAADAFPASIEFLLREIYN